MQRSRGTAESEFIASSASPESFPPEGLPEVAFLGRSNVGKSSLINALAVRPGMAFTSSKPGRTRTLNFYRIKGAFLFVDLPGYGYARVSRREAGEWQRLIERYLLERQSLALSCLVLDARRGWMEPDLQLKEWLEFHERRYLVVATKVDKLNQAEQKSGLAAIAQHDGEPLPFSAVTGRGVREIWQAITKTLDKSQA